MNGDSRPMMQLMAALLKTLAVVVTIWLVLMLIVNIKEARDAAQFNSKAVEKNTEALEDILNRLKMPVPPPEKKP